MRALFLSLLLASPAWAQEAHTGIVRPRTAPELSDIALFVAAACAVWWARRALRRRATRND